MASENYYHVVSAKRHGWKTICVSTIFMAIILMMGVKFFKIMDWAHWFAIVWYIIFGIVYLGSLIYGTMNIMNGGEWVCIVDDKKIKVVTPSNVLGDSFELPLTSLVQITNKVGLSELSRDEYYICTIDKRYRVPIDSGIDVRKVMEIIEAKTGIKCVEERI